ncbi:hypothetical protein LXL04_029268 [Taraxacum kok-saghyz]
MVQSSNQSLYRAWAIKNRCDCDEPRTFSISRTGENPGQSFRVVCGVGSDKGNQRNVDTDDETSEDVVGDDVRYVWDDHCTGIGCRLFH